MPADRTTPDSHSRHLSRRSALRGLMSAASALALAGCATMAGTGPETTAAIISQPTVLVATTRKPVNGGHSKPWFGPDRARGGAVTVALAKLRPPGGGRFLGIGDWAISSVEPTPQLATLLGDATNRDILMYVHGYNQSFEQAVLDGARLSDSVRFAGDTMVFSWPSRGSVFDYNFDRESAMLSRDALDQEIEDLLASPAVGRVNIVAHSVGTGVTTEALRVLYAKLGDYAADRVGAIVLASPDIDMDVFMAAIPRIGPLAGKITVITATDDRALAVSRMVNGSSTSRVGAAEKAQLEGLGIKVIDASQQGWGVLNHDLFLSNAGVRQAIRDAIGGPPSHLFSMPSIQIGESLPPPLAPAPPPAPTMGAAPAPGAAAN